MQKYLKFIMPTIIIILISALAITKCSKDKIVDTNHESEFKAKINAQEAELVAIRNDGEAKRQKWIKDSLGMKASEINYKRIASKATKERDQARAKIQYLYDSIPEVKEFVDIDSISDKINIDRINTLEVEKVTISNDCRAMMNVKDDEIKIAISLKNDFKTENEKLFKQFKKERNWKTFWQWTAGILGAAIIAQSLDIF